MALRSRLIAFVFSIAYFSIFQKFLFFACFCFNVAHIFVDVTDFQGSIPWLVPDTCLLLGQPYINKFF